MATQKQSIVEDGSLEFTGAQKADAQALSAPFSGLQDLAEANVQPALVTDVRCSIAPEGFQCEEFHLHRNNVN